MKRKKIGEVLVEAGLVTEAQVEMALKLQRGKAKRLGKILMELGYVNERQVAEALSRLLNLPFVECSDRQVANDVVGRVPKAVAESKMVFPLEQAGRTLTLAMADPLDWETVDAIAFRSGLKVQPIVAPESCVLHLLERHYGSSAKIYDLLKQLPAYEHVEFLKEEIEDPVGADEAVVSVCNTGDSPPIVKLVTMIIADAVRSEASDVHIEPQEQAVQVRYRIDGELRSMLKVPKHVQEAVISRIKIISNLDITNRRLPQDGRCSLLFESHRVDLRISTLPSVHGEKIVIRLLDPERGLMSFSQLGMGQEVLDPLLEIIRQPQGMLLVTGPTGSGKTSTLYAVLQQLRTESENIVSIEDPVEYRMAGITQVGVNEPIGLTFASVLRSVLRQDPDIIMVGEIRDRETAEIASRSALTGHLVLSTLHTNDTVATISRLLEIGLEPFLVTAALSGVLAQRLVRRICPECRMEIDVPETFADSELPPLSSCFRGLGCDACGNSGFQGRVGVYEYLPLTRQIKRLIAHNATDEELRQAAREAGMRTLFEAAWDKVARGVTSIDEVMSKVPFDGFTGSWQATRGQRDKGEGMDAAPPL